VAGFRCLIVCLALLLGCSSSPPPTSARAPAPVEPDATLWTGGRIVTPTGDVDGMRTAGGLITHTWTGERPQGVDGEQIDLGGATVIPGLVDAHLHLRGIGRAARRLSVKGTTSAEAVAELVRAATDRPAGTWIRGRGWDQNDWAVQEFPNASLLDAVAPEHPVWLTRVDGHAAWVNSQVLRSAGIDANTPDPPGGKYLRDEQGAPTGVLIDMAMDVVAGVMPSPTDAELRADLESGIALCLAAGLTGVHDMGVGSRIRGLLETLEQEGALKLRVSAYLGDGSELRDRISGPPDREGLLQFPGVKLFADGALGSRGAALKAPYDDAPETSGLLQMEEKAFNAKARMVHNAGYQLAIHAIGDRGISMALDAIEAAQGSDRTRRHRVEHAQVVDVAEFSRFAELGVVASMQPTHATSDMPWAEARVGPERIVGAYAWRRMLDAGVPLAFGSDAPVEEHAPRFGLHAAVTRTGVDGTPAGGWRMDQALDIGEALAAFSTGAAYAAHREGGALVAGAPADFVVLGSDPRTQGADLLKLDVRRTVVAGDSVFVK